MNVLAIIVGLILVISVVFDLINTLVATRSARGRYWLTRILYEKTWSGVRTFGSFLGETQREAVYASYAPLSVLALLVAWVSQRPQ